MSVGRPLLKALLEIVVNPVGAIGHLADALFAGRDRRAAVEALFDEAVPWVFGVSSPAALLDADRCIVDFHAGREGELADLAAWLDDPEGLPLMVRLYVAQGGYGKTRLLRELVGRRRGDEKARRRRFAELLRGERWDAGFLGDGATAPDLAPLLAGRRPLLLVLDYAESRGAQLRALVAAARASRRRRVRLVLLARSEAGWWQDLKSADDGVGELFLGRAVDDPRPLGPVADTPELRRTAFDTAAAAFAGKLGQEPPATAPPLDDPAFERILLVHALALAAVEGEPGVPGEELLDWLLARERRGLDRAAERLGLPATARPAVHRAAALVTLALGADTLPELQEIVARTPDLPTDAVAPCAEALRRLYRGKRWCEGVQPDLVGEHLVDAELREAEENGDPRLLEAALGDGVPPPRRQAALTVLTRLAKRSLEAARHLDAAFRLRPLAPLAEAAIAVAQAEGDPVGRHLATALAAAPDPELASRLAPLLPQTTTALREVKLEVTQQRYRAARESTPEDAPDDQLDELAGLLNDLSIRLGEVGRREEGLEAIEEAVEVYRRLARSRPEAFEPALAMSLNNLSLRLADLGRREEGLAAIEAAVEVRRRLARSRPEAFEPDLARSLNNLSNRLSDLGRREEGLAAIEEAVAIRRHLARSRPEAFEPALATSLNNLSNRLSDLGRREEGLAAIEEAVAVYRRLARSRPEAFEPDLATSLNNLSVRLAALGRQEEGLAAIEEAVEVRRRLARSRPEAFEPDLATSLNNLSNHLSDLGRREEGLAAIEEAVEIRRRLARSRPEAFEPALAMSLNNLSNRMSDTGRREEGLAAIEEAVEVRRRLARSRPEAFEPDLARSLGNLADQWLEAGLADAGADAADEALRRLLPHLERNPRGLGDLGGWLLSVYRRATSAAGRPLDEALVARVEALLAA